MTTFHARSVAQCWAIARRTARAYQREMARCKTAGRRTLCQAGRDAADRVALEIRYGRKRGQS